MSITEVAQRQDPVVVCVDIVRGFPLLVARGNVKPRHEHAGRSRPPPPRSSDARTIRYVRTALRALRSARSRDDRSGWVTSSTGSFTMAGSVARVYLVVRVAHIFAGDNGSLIGESSGGWNPTRRVPHSVNDVIRRARPERQYQAVEPENRLVESRTLEGRRSSWFMLVSRLRSRKARFAHRSTHCRVRTDGQLHCSVDRERYFSFRCDHCPNTRSSSRRRTERSSSTDSPFRTELSNCSLPPRANRLAW